MDKSINKTRQIDLLNYLLLATEDQFHYCASIKLAIENRLKAIQEFLVDDSSSDEKVVQALARFAIPIIQYQIHIENYSFTIKNNPKIIQHIYKYIQAFPSLLNFVSLHSNKMLEFNNYISQNTSPPDKEIRIHKVKNEMRSQIRHNFDRIFVSVNMCIYSLANIIQEIEDYLKFLGQNKSSLLFYTGNYTAYVDSIAQEITQHLNNDDRWLWAFYKPLPQKISYIRRMVDYIQSLWTYRYSNQYCLVIKESNYELASYEELQKFQAENVVKKITINLMNPQVNLPQKGFFVKTNNNKMKIVFSNETDYNLFRGQCKKYKQLIPSFQRLNSDNIEHCIEFIKREEFKEFFKLTPYYKILRQLNVLGSYFEFDLDAIAQHYGFATNYLDITQDREVALFFAYTYPVDDKYFPIDDFTNFQPILYKAHFGFYPNNNNPLIPIGFQAVLRPQNQMAMAIVSNNPQTNLISYFEPELLEQNVKLARQIYDKFEGGEKLFPKNEPIHIVESELKERRTLSEHLFLEYCKKFNKDENEINQQLIQKDYTISKSMQPNYEKLFTKMKKDIDEKIIPWIKENVLYYRKFCKSDDLPTNLLPQSLK